ncbi:MAG: 2-oxo acid dehydrogenase subunit E2 [SAR202 cluster bacterium]|nr:2-oxo acid dehydrogenase subunit E2 [SAR202 cluster bacterium]
MSEELNMPQMGYDMKEGVVVKWLKEEGSEVKVGEPVAEIETDKAVVEFESYAEGTLEKILVEEGTKVNVGEPIAIVGDGTNLMEEEEVQEEEVQEEEVQEEEVQEEIQQEEIQQEEIQQEEISIDQKIKASPLAKTLANDNNIDLNNVIGTGPGGRIVKSDILQLIDNVETTEKVKINFKLETNEVESQIQDTDSTVKEENKMRAQIARVTQRSKQEVPHYYLSTDINMDNALEIRSQINSKLAYQNIKISINDMIMKSVIDTLKKFPIFNSRYENGTVNMNEEINVSVAIALEDGLIMPSIINCNDMDIKQLSIASKDLVDRTKNGKLTSAEYTKGTFSISNLGMFDVNSFLAIILPPQTAMLAVGSVKKIPIVSLEEDIMISNIMNTSLSADHRVTDGAEGAKFLAEIKNNLENPVNLII